MSSNYITKNQALEHQRKRRYQSVEMIDFSTENHLNPKIHSTEASISYPVNGMRSWTANVKFLEANIQLLFTATIESYIAHIS